MRLPVAVALFALAALPAFAQKSTREEEQRQRRALDHYKKGQDAMASERLDQAVREFKAAIELDPLLTLARYRLGQAHMSLRDYPQAEQAFLGCRDAYDKIASLQFTNVEEGERRREQEIEQLQNQLSLIQSGQIKSSNPSVPMQISQRIDELQRSRRKGGTDAVTVPADRVRKEVDGQYAEVNKQIVIPGFRPGKAPRRLLESKFGVHIQGEVKQKIVEAAY